MISLVVLAVLLVLTWLWALWQREGMAAGMQQWTYTLLVGAAACAVMALGLWLRQLLT